MAQPTLDLQYAYRSYKELGLASGPPVYTHSSAFQKPQSSTRLFTYSSDGSAFAYCVADSLVIVDPVTSKQVACLKVPNIVELDFSPKATYLSTWERMIKSQDGSPPHKNLKIWSLEQLKQASSSEQQPEPLMSFTQRTQEGWKVQFSQDESAMLRSVTNEVHVYNPADFQAGIVNKLYLEGVSSFLISPGQNPNIAAFVAQKKGAPACVKIYSLAALSSISASKSFYKADTISLKWNSTGSNLLFLTQTDHDKSGKSYYGETSLYLMNAAGQFDCRVTLDKEGGIHDFSWSPNGKEFIVCYGYIPSKAMLFDQRANLVHDFGLNPRNTIRYNPQGRLIAVAGFGNLAGTVDIWDRQTLKKVSSFESPNSTVFDWSPDGRFLLCGTLSPRLRVDNGVQIYHFNGTLLHTEDKDELYQVEWRPQPTLGSITDVFSTIPAPSSAAAAKAQAKSTAKVGAYRPPALRAAAAGSENLSTSFSSTPVKSNGNNNPSSVPGAVPGTSSASTRKVIPGLANASAGQQQSKTTSRRKRKDKRDDDADGNGNGAKPAPAANVAPAASTAASIPAAQQQQSANNNAQGSASAEGPLSPEAKRKRALVKRLTAIDTLKVRRDRGDKLEKTQLMKIDAEQEIRKELESLELS